MQPMLVASPIPSIVIVSFQMVRKISQSQSSYRTKPDIIIDEIYEDEEDSDDSSSSLDKDKESNWLVKNSGSFSWIFLPLVLHRFRMNFNVFINVIKVSKNGNLLSQTEKGTSLKVLTKRFFTMR